MKFREREGIFLETKNKKEPFLQKFVPQRSSQNRYDHSKFWKH